MTNPQPHTFRFASERDGSPVELEGFIVPDTDGLLFIDERYPAEGFEEPVWFITHLPTSRHMQAKVPEIHTRERAVQVAQQLFREFTARGLNLNTKSANAIKASVDAMTDEERGALWRAVGA
jgi:hypothetical protein